jgi:hypothetical protein
MPNTPVLGLPYPAASVPPDIPGDIYNLAVGLENGPLAQGVFGPGFGGTGATLGATGGTSGYYVRTGKRMTYFGRLLFGSSASWGTGSAVVTGLNLAGDFNTSIVDGTGWFDCGPNGGANANQRINIKLTPLNGSQFYIHVANTSPLGSAFSLPGPAQSAELHFKIDGVLA